MRTNSQKGDAVDLIPVAGVIRRSRRAPIHVLRRLKRIMVDSSNPLPLLTHNITHRTGLPRPHFIPVVARAIRRSRRAPTCGTQSGLALRKSKGNALFPFWMDTRLSLTAIAPSCPTQTPSGPLFLPSPRRPSLCPYLFPRNATNLICP